MWVSFLAYGILISIFVWLLQRRSWRIWLRLSLIIIVVCIFAIVVYIGDGPETLGPRERWYTENPGREIVFFVLMLLGMTARYLTQAIESRRERIKKLQKKGDRFKKPRIEFDIWEFSYPMLVSVITFGALLSQIEETAPTLASMTLSFQTGFFWQTILAAKQDSE